MKLIGSGRGFDSIQDIHMIQHAIRIREALEHKWKRMMKPVYFKIKFTSGEKFEEEDCHDWEKELMNGSVLAIVKVTPDHVILGLALTRSPPYYEGFDTGFIHVQNTTVFINHKEFTFEVYSPSA
jgi:hypothetical protein